MRGLGEAALNTFHLWRGEFPPGFFKGTETITGSDILDLLVFGLILFVGPLILPYLLGLPFVMVCWAVEAAEALVKKLGFRSEDQ